jgi:hypothetical protein
MLEEELSRHEEEHGIVIRWTPQMKEYQEALVMMTERRYRLALDNVERLVVSRLLEMTKLGMSGVGMSGFTSAPKIASSYSYRVQASREDR